MPAAASHHDRAQSHPNRDPREFDVLVIGDERHESRMYGSTFDQLGCEPRYVPAPLATTLDRRPDVILVSWECLRSTRVAVAQARRRGIPVIYLMDGVVEWSYVWNNLTFVRPEGTVLQPLLASHLAVVSQHQARIAASLGLADRTHVIGMPRLDGVGRHRIVDLSAQPSIVVATANTPGHNVEQRVLVRRALRDLKAWFDGQHHVSPIWRIAPELAWELEVTPDTSGPAVDVLRRANALISFTSTLLLEGMTLGLPTAQIDYRAVPQYVQTAWDVRCAEQIPGVIQDLLFPRPERLAYQDACLKDELEPGCASERLAELVYAAVTGTTDVSPVQPSTGGGRLDYRQVHSELSAFALSPASLVQYELEAMSGLLDRTLPEYLRLREQHEAQQRMLDRLGGMLEQHDHAHAIEEAFRQRVYTDRLRPLIRRLRRDGIDRVVIYGAGDVGRALVPACRAAGIAVDGIADRDAVRWGSSLAGVTITSLDAVDLTSTRVIVLASFTHAAAMRRAVLHTLGGKPEVRIVAPRPWRL